MKHWCQHFSYCLQYGFSVTHCWLNKASIFLRLVGQCLQTTLAIGTHIAGLQNEVPYPKIHRRQTQKKQMLALQKWEGRKKIKPKAYKNPTVITSGFINDNSDLKNTHLLMQKKKKRLPIYFFCKLKSKWSVYKMNHSTQPGHDDYKNIYSRSLFNVVHEIAVPLFSWPVSVVSQKVTKFYLRFLGVSLFFKLKLLI